MARYVFPQWTQKFLPLVGVLLAGGPIYLITLIYFGESAEAVRIGYRPHQPIAYSHALHVGELGLDCRYCHDTVDRAARAAIPTPTTCMNCHTHVLPASEKLALVREAVEKGTPIRWKRVHDLPDYVYFNHSAHVVRGVGCESCHGRIDKMDEVYQAKPLTMSWCLECHRAPEQHLRDPAMVTAMGFKPAGDRLEYGKKLKACMKTDPAHDCTPINPPTNCSTCHR